MNPATDHVCSYDLHSHTYWSYDALAAPEMYFEQARKAGIRCFAITEHHCVDSQREVMALAKKHPEIRVIPAAELTVTTSIGSVDLLCYGVPIDGVDSGLAPEALAGWKQVREKYHRWQREYGASTCRALRAIGLDYTDEHRIQLLESYRPRKTTEFQGHTHVRNATQREYFIERGFIRTAEEYSPLLKRARTAASAWVPYPHVNDVAPAVKRLGAVVVIAHPFPEYFKGVDRARMEMLRAECQLDGIECAHYWNPPEAAADYRAYCVEHGLVSTGGWDSHTEENIREGFGRHGGEERWLEEMLERLPRHAAEYPR